MEWRRIPTRAFGEDSRYFGRHSNQEPPRARGLSVTSSLDCLIIFVSFPLIWGRCGPVFTLTSLSNVQGIRFYFCVGFLHLVVGRAPVGRKTRLLDTSCQSVSLNVSAWSSTGRISAKFAIREICERNKNLVEIGHFAWGPKYVSLSATLKLHKRTLRLLG
jgi:hypothetical protein